MPQAQVMVQNKMKKFIFTLSLIISIVMIGISFTYANGRMLVGALLMTLTSFMLLWNEVKEDVERKTHMKL